ncbi:uncharacterized protein MCYG_01552 [Microsporum canis CBS 113480]|uniref:Uncharacterized protein n=1 Tax=Arthroderma otae (strain ATCC MYA-4605 / CBS 113480) TaxID=554155 RepID=C5FHJ3_ARTOC|nr:uncharacterized protein MCYG_01552 [Microsporum canis CBS 113480]EEQ28733.1 hypothetical protein MCYG_01552 [Microsporum canis CBS 113480]
MYVLNARTRVLCSTAPYESEMAPATHILECCNADARKSSERIAPRTYSYRATTCVPLDKPRPSKRYIRLTMTYLRTGIGWKVEAPREQGLVKKKKKKQLERSATAVSRTLIYFSITYSPPCPASEPCHKEET